MAKKTILIADDDRDFLTIEGGYLVTAGYNILCARDAYHALHLAVQDAPDLLLLDINMPAGNGLSVHERMRKLAPSRDIPVIYVTGERSNDFMELAKKMEAYCVMYKPFELVTLLNNVRAALGEIEPPEKSGPRFDAEVAWTVSTAAL